MTCLDNVEVVFKSIKRDLRSTSRVQWRFFCVNLHHSESNTGRIVSAKRRRQCTFSGQSMVIR